VSALAFDDIPYFSASKQTFFYLLNTSCSPVVSLTAYPHRRFQSLTLFYDKILADE
jgi:hypothetical protein